MYDELFIMEHLKILNLIIKKWVEPGVMVCLHRVIYSTIKPTLFSIDILCFQTSPMTLIGHTKKKWPKSLNSTWRLDCVDGSYCYHILKIKILYWIVLKIKVTAVTIVVISMPYYLYLKHISF